MRLSWSYAHAKGMKTLLNVSENNLEQLFRKKMHFRYLKFWSKIDHFWAFFTIFWSPNKQTRFLAWETDKFAHIVNFFENFKKFLIF